MNTETERFLTKKEALEYLSVNGGIIMVNRVVDHSQGRLGRLIMTDWYVVGLDVIEKAYEVGMEIETDLDGIYED